jgi:hypothetical protein
MHLSKQIAASAAAITLAVSGNASAGGFLENVGRSITTSVTAPIQVLQGRDPGQVARDTLSAHGQVLQQGAGAVGSVNSQLDRTIGGAIGQFGGPSAEWVYNNAMATRRFGNELGTTTAQSAGLVLQGQSPDMIFSAILASTIREAVDHYEDEAEPLPDEWKDALSVYYTPEQLDNARYVIDPSFQLSLPALIGNGQAAFGGGEFAVTVGNIIVFHSAPANDPQGVWWVAHEMQHTIQYDHWGIDLFANRYMHSHDTVEAQADQAANQTMQNLSSALRSGSQELYLSDASW